VNLLLLSVTQKTKRYILPRLILP